MAMMKVYYGLRHWNIPEDYLCPSVPSRADYIHHLSDLINATGVVKPHQTVSGLDIGTGASLVFPIIGVSEYNWNFVASDIDDRAIGWSRNHIRLNPKLNNKIVLRKQMNPSQILYGVVKGADEFHFCMVNPPFYDSMETANKETLRKWIGLRNKSLIKQSKKDNAPVRNFGGTEHELVYKDGGQYGFIKALINESADPFMHERIKIFSTLVSNEDDLPKINNLLHNQKKITQVFTKEMKHGSKKSRIVAWQY